MKDFKKTRKIGICVHSYEGGTLCFYTACQAGSRLMGTHMHPGIVLSAIPMGLSMKGWESGDYEEVARYLSEGVKEVAGSGADFFICPDNTAHLVLERIIDELPVPGLHIADVVGREIKANGRKKAGLLGTKWTMTGSVYEDALARENIAKLIPGETTREKINEAIFEELCQGVFKEETTELFTGAIEDLKREGADCVILGCTEIPLIITHENSPLPILDTTRLLAEYAVRLAVSETELPRRGWVAPV